VDRRAFILGSVAVLAVPLAAGRVGFQRLVAEVSLGRVGAVISLEVSRLARNNRDWYQLLDLCGLLNTLIIDAEGVYDPRQLNDRLLSEAELGWLRHRAAPLLPRRPRHPRPDGGLSPHGGVPIGVEKRDGAFFRWDV
jgi:hypothetical protein